MNININNLNINFKCDIAAILSVWFAAELSPRFNIYLPFILRQFVIIELYIEFIMYYFAFVS